MLKDALDSQSVLDDGAQMLARDFGPVVVLEFAVFKACVNKILLQCGLVGKVDFGASPRCLVQGRLRDVEVSVFDDLVHVPEEEGEQERSNVGAVNVRIRHDDDFVVLQRIDVEVLFADSGSQRRDERSNVFGRDHFAEVHALDIEDFSPQRQHGLVAAVARLLRGAARRISLNDENLGLGGVPFLAVGELAGKARDFKSAFFAIEFAGLSRGFPGDGGLDDFGSDGFCVRWIFLEPGAE